MMKRFFAIAIVALFVVACSSTSGNEKTKKGAVIGAATGAAAGAVIGNQNGSAKKGAAVGAVVGGAVGAAIGHRMDQQEKELKQIPNVEVQRPSQDEIKVVVANDILFPFDSAELTPSSKSSLRDMANVFEKYPGTTIKVQGYTDSIGTASYNQSLSERRALAVKDYLTQQGVTADRIQAIGYGESDPVASNATPAGRQENRRVELAVKAQPEQQASAQ
ncbi:MAG: OmpA family protein [Thermoanaerobaculia bacterium]